MILIGSFSSFYILHAFLSQKIIFQKIHVVVLSAIKKDFILFDLQNYPNCTIEYNNIFCSVATLVCVRPDDNFIQRSLCDIRVSENSVYMYACTYVRYGKLHINLLLINIAFFTFSQSFEGIILCN